MIKLKNDRFRKTRGGASKLLTLVCGNCRTKLFDYQKDGKGTIIRLYLDRIVLNHQNIAMEGGNIACPDCQKILGNVSIYKKESREALFLERGAVVKWNVGV